MKKAFSIFGVAIILLTTVLTSCDEKKPCPPIPVCPGPGEILVDTTSSTDTTTAPVLSKEPKALITQWSVTVVVYKINGLGQKVYVNNATVSLPCSGEANQQTNGSGATTFRFGDDSQPCDCQGDSVFASKSPLKGGNVVSACGNTIEVKIE